MTTITAARLIELLAKHIEEHGNAHVAMPYGDKTGEYVAVMRCWYDSDRKCVVVGGR